MGKTTVTILFNFVFDVKLLHFIDHCVTCSLRNTFVDTRQWSRAIFPSNLYCLLKTRHGHLLNGKFQDAHNFLLSLLDSTIVDELHNNSSITSNFLSLIKSTVTCKECGSMCSQLSKYFSIQIDILKTVRIQEALKIFFGIENVDKFCEKCKKNVTATKQFKLTQVPTILCLQIKRFTNQSKIEDCVEILHDLTIPKQMAHNISSDMKYKLMAIICHIGSLDFGHYKTIVCENENLYEFDDALVKPIPFRKKIRSKEAYLVFYELQNRDDINSEDEV